MSEIIKRAADAISDVLADTIGLSHTEVTELMARSVIAAMREPTAEMLFVGSNDEAGFTQRNLLDSWRLMIDEALASSPLSSNNRGAE